MENPTSSSHPSGSRLSSTRSEQSVHSAQSRRSRLDEETAPLLSTQENGQRLDYRQLQNDPPSSPAARSLQSINDGLEGKTKGRRRWPSIVALSLLSGILVAILCLGFIVPSVVEDYAQQAAVFKPTNISIDSLTATGLRARVQGTFKLDSSKVRTKSVADIGRIGTWIAKEVETGETSVRIFLPERSDSVLGVAVVPPLKLNIRDKTVNIVDASLDLEPSDILGIRQLATDFFDGRLGSLLVEAVASVPLKSGILNLGTRTVAQSLLLEGQGHGVPEFPKVDIEALKFTEVGPPSKPKGILASASVSAKNDYPAKFDIPPLQFDILVPNCPKDQDHLFFAKTETGTMHVHPEQVVDLNVIALIQEIPKELTTPCPISAISPLDAVLATYLQGEDTVLYVRGGSDQGPATPDWMTNLIKGMTVPLPLPNRPFGNLIRNFSMAHVHFSLPDPFARPDSPQSRPTVSATVKALAALPKEMEFHVDVDRVRAEANIFYKGSKLGELDLQNWQKARTSKVQEGDLSLLLIESDVDEVPLNVTNNELFADLMRSLIFGTEGVVLGINASVDISSKTALGEFVVRKLPAKGRVNIKALSEGGIGGLNPQIGSLKILETTKSSLQVRALVNITNPTEYSAQVPYVNINILHNNTVLGNVFAEDLHIVPGNNHNLEVKALWKPSVGGAHGTKIGRNLISQYLSGYNTTLTLKTHSGTIPSQPALGKALSKLEMVIDAPKISFPGPPGGGDDDDPDGGEEGPRFVRGATMYLITSTATFKLFSPLPTSTLYITSIHATAFYNHTIPVGTIDNALPMAVPPGKSVTPPVSVAWDIDGTGYSAILDALHGSLKLDTIAYVGVKIDHWEEQLWFIGRGIGAHIRL